MVSTMLKNLVTDRRLSSVVPSEAGPEDNKDHELTPTDLALKLHYVKGVYFFKSEAVHGLDIDDFKTPMFPWLSLDHTVAGRIRRSESGRPFIKCNDSGVRIVEANCDQTVDEWVGMNDHLDSVFNDGLVFDGVLGPDLAFSPMVFIQITWFKCGGVSVGLNWAHVLGDPFSASSFLNMWTQFMEGHKPIHPVHLAKPKNSHHLSPNSTEPLSLKRVDPVGDHWLVNNSTSGLRMRTHSFLVTTKQLENMLSSVCNGEKSDMVANFNVLSAVIWKTLATVKGDSATRIVTFCSSTRKQDKTEVPTLGNNLLFSIVKAESPVMEYKTRELVALIGEKQEEENSLIEEIVEMGDGKEDFTLYGNNLTFINMEEADHIYDLKFKGHKPIFANYSVSGVGDQGAVIVLPGPDKNGGENKEGNAKTITVVLPENEVAELKKELQKEWGIV